MRFILPGTKSDHGRVTPQARKWRIFWSYLPDWVLTIFLWGIFYLLDKVDGYRRLFDVTDNSLAHPYATHERVKVWHLAFYAGIIPAVIIILTGALVRKSIWDVHSGILGLLLNLGLTITFTNIVKITAGRPRPDLFDRCQLPADLTANPVHGLTSWTACTQTDLLQEGFRSFPSGHSSFAWAGMWYLILYGAAKMRISNKRGHTWKSWILLAPLSGAALISVSRTMDYRHHSTDVIAGAIIGVLVAWYAYRQFYPPLSHPQAFKPYSPRIAKEESIPLHHSQAGVGRPSVEGTTSSLLPSPANPHGATRLNGNANTINSGYPPQVYGNSYAPPIGGGGGKPARDSEFTSSDGYNDDIGESVLVSKRDRDEERSRGEDREASETVQR